MIQLLDRQSLTHYLSYLPSSQCLQGRDLDYIFVCVGGGGMLAGIAAYIKAVNPEVKVIGVEADDAAGPRL